MLVSPKSYDSIPAFQKSIGNVFTDFFELFCSSDENAKKQSSHQVGDAS